MSEPLVLITGISGFIAKHCAVEMLRQGYRVRGTVRGVAKAAEVRATLAAQADVGGLDCVTADLLADDGWDAAMQGVDAVLHLASPFPSAEPRDPDDLLRPAIDGTLRVLASATRAGVARFVQTSSTVAIGYGHPRDRTAPFTAADWTQVDGPGVSSYAKSKTLAERAAREFVARTPNAPHFSSVNPGLVLGPALDRDIGSSGEFIQRFLQGKYPGCPRLCFPVVDVRDVAKMHRLALAPELPSGGRYLAVSETAWFIDMMRPIKRRLGPAARRVPVFELPDFVVRLIGLVDARARGIVGELSRHPTYDTRATRAALPIDFIPVSESAPAMAQSLVDLKLAASA
jgi:dihydroflavonol-4-reductase